MNITRRILGLFCLFLVGRNNVHAVKTVTVEDWIVPSENEAFPDVFVRVGDTMVWKWPADERHTVQYHPSNTCTGVDDQVTVQPWSAGPGSYTFTEADREVGPMFFVCDIADHCQEGMNMRVFILPPLCIDVNTDNEDDEDEGDAPVAPPTVCSDRPAEPPTTITVEPLPSTSPPTVAPTRAPTRTPTPQPTQSPTKSPTKNPAQTPTRSPTRGPTKLPTRVPTGSPTALPLVSITPMPSASLTSAFLEGEEGDGMNATAVPTTMETNSTVEVDMPEGDPEEEEEEEEEEDLDSPNSDQDTEESSRPPPEKVEATISFSLLVQGGKADSIPFDDYSPQLLSTADRLAESAIDEIDDLTRDQQQRRLEEDQEQISVDDGDLKISLLELATVETFGFTSDPSTTSLGIFVDGACPLGSGSVQDDRCEQIQVKIDLLMGSDYDPNVIGEAFQDALDTALYSGKMQFFMSQDFPDSRVRILTGLLLSDIMKANDPQVGQDVSQAQAPADDQNDGFEFTPRIIGGIAAAGAVILGTIVLVLCSKKKNKNKPPRAVQADLAIEAKGTFPPSPTQSDLEADLVIPPPSLVSGDDDKSDNELLDVYSLSAADTGSTATDQIMMGNRVVDLTGPSFDDNTLDTDVFEFIEAAVTSGDYEAIGEAIDDHRVEV